MIKVFHNSHGSGDWIHIKEGDLTIFEGRSVEVNDLVLLLQRYAADVKLFKLTDEEMDDVVYDAYAARCTEAETRNHQEEPNHGKGLTKSL